MVFVMAAWADEIGVKSAELTNVHLVSKVLPQFTSYLLTTNKCICFKDFGGCIFHKCILEYQWYFPFTELETQRWKELSEPNWISSQNKTDFVRSLWVLCLQGLHTSFELLVLQNSTPQFIQPLLLLVLRSCPAYQERSLRVETMY